MPYNTDTSGCSMVSYTAFSVGSASICGPQGEMQPQRDVRILGGVLGSAVHVELDLKEFASRPYPSLLRRQWS